MAVSMCREALPSMGKHAQPLSSVISVRRDCRRIDGGRWGRRQISMALWCPGRHSCYNGRDNGLLSRKAELIPSNSVSVRIEGCNSPSWSRNR